MQELFEAFEPVKVVVDARVKNRKLPNNQSGKEVPGKVWFDRHDSGTRILEASRVYDTGV